MEKNKQDSIERRQEDKQQIMYACWRREHSHASHLFIGCMFHLIIAHYTIFGCFSDHSRLAYSQGAGYFIC